MKRGEEIQVTIEKGKTLIIKMNGLSEPDEDGNRIVLFEFNGQPRLLKFMINMLRQLALFVVKRMNLTLVKLVLHCLVPLLRF